jgi:two-component system response regulator AtoC
MMPDSRGGTPWTVEGSGRETEARCIDMSLHVLTSRTVKQPADDLLDTSVRPVVAPAGPPSALLLLTLHPETIAAAHPRSLPLRALPLSLGRDRSSSIRFDDPSVSRHHARVEPRGEGHVLVDLGSRNGSFVNRRRVRGETSLTPGDIVRLGDVVLLFASRTVEEAQETETSREAESSLVGGPRLAAARRQIRLLGRTPLRIAILGESGTGKELAARELHRASGRSGPFIAVNCAALPEPLVEAELFGHAKGAFTSATADKPGLFEAARGGTLFLDEVAELPLASQAKLLRVVESGELRRVGAVRSTRVDCRLLSATNHDLDDAVAKRRFRADLAARLAEAKLELPPLRERIEDLPLLVEHLGRRAGARPSLSAEVVEALACYPWPLNVRELDNTIRTLVVLAQGGEVTLSMLPLHLLAARRAQGKGRPGGSGSEAILAALRRNGGNIRRTSQELGVSRTRVYRCLDRSGLTPADLRAGTEDAS